MDTARTCGKNVPGVIELETVRQARAAILAGRWTEWSEDFMGRYQRGGKEQEKEKQ